MFTMPWSPTGAFPHPLANLDANKVDARVANYLSYYRMELLTWEVRNAELSKICSAVTPTAR